MEDTVIYSDSFIASLDTEQSQEESLVYIPFTPGRDIWTVGVLDTRLKMPVKNYVMDRFGEEWLELVVDWQSFWF